MKKWILILIAKLMVTSNLFAFQVVQGEGYQFVDISLKDTNRIICPVSIGQAIFSKEKNIQVKIAGQNAFVKIIPHQELNPETGQQKLVYPSYPRELYLECGGKIFSLVLTPKDIPAETIALRLPAYEKEKAAEYEKSGPYRKTLLGLIRSAYLEQPPEGYQVEEINQPLKNSDKIEVFLRRKMKGAHYVVYEYVIMAKQKVNLDEIHFLHITRNPLAISLSKLILTEGETARLFIVSRKS